MKHLQLRFIKSLWQREGPLFLKQRKLFNKSFKYGHTRQWKSTHLSDPLQPVRGIQVTYTLAPKTTRNALKQGIHLRHQHQSQGFSFLQAIPHRQNFSPVY